MCLGTLVQDGFAHMCGVTWRAVPAKFKTGMCEMKKIGSEVCSVSWEVGSGWVGTKHLGTLGVCLGDTWGGTRGGSGEPTPWDTDL